MLMTLYTCSQEPKLQLRSLEDDKDLVLALSVASSDSKVTVLRYGVKDTLFIAPEPVRVNTGFCNQEGCRKPTWSGPLRSFLFLIACTCACSLLESNSRLVLLMRSSYCGSPAITLTS